MPDIVTRHRTARLVDLLFEVPAVIITFVMMLHIVVNAVMRTWFRAPIDNTLETVTYWYLPLVAFLGFVAAGRRGEHIAADLIYEMLPRVTRRFVLAVLLVASSLLCLAFAWFGLGEALHAKSIGKTAGVSSLVAWPTYFLVPIAFGLLSLQFLYSAVRALVSGEALPAVGDPDDAVVAEELAASEGRPA